MDLQYELLRGLKWTQDFGQNVNKRVAVQKSGSYELTRKIEENYTKYPFYGSRRIAENLSRMGLDIGRKRVQSLMRKMGIMGIALGPMTSKPHPQHKTYPYLLKDVEATAPNQIWSTDITYIPTYRQNSGSCI